MAIALLEVRERSEGLAGEDARDPRLALRCRAAVQQSRDEELRRQERSRRGRATQLLQDEDEIERSQPETAFLLGHDETHPPELRHLAVEVARDAVFRCGRVAHERGRAFPREEVPRRLLQGFLVLGQAEVDHRART